MKSENALPNICMLSLLQCINMYVLYLVKSTIQSLHDDLYKQASVASLSQFIGCLLSGFMLARVSDRV